MSNKILGVLFAQGADGPRQKTEFLCLCDQFFQAMIFSWHASNDFLLSGNCPLQVLPSWKQFSGWMTENACSRLPIFCNSMEFQDDELLFEEKTSLFPLFFAFAEIYCVLLLWNTKQQHQKSVLVAWIRHQRDRNQLIERCLDILVLDSHSDEDILHPSQKTSQIKRTICSPNANFGEAAEEKNWELFGLNFKISKEYPVYNKSEIHAIVRKNYLSFVIWRLLSSYASERSEVRAWLTRKYGCYFHNTSSRLWKWKPFPFTVCFQEGLSLSKWRPREQWMTRYLISSSPLGQLQKPYPTTISKIRCEVTGFYLNLSRKVLQIRRLLFTPTRLCNTLYIGFCCQETYKYKHLAAISDRKKSVPACHWQRQRLRWSYEAWFPQLRQDKEGNPASVNSRGFMPRWQAVSVQGSWPGDLTCASSMWVLSQARGKLVLCNPRVICALGTERNLSGILSLSLEVSTGSFIFCSLKLSPCQNVRAVNITQ